MSDTFGPWRATGERRPGGSADVLRVESVNGRAAALKLARRPGDPGLANELATLRSVAEVDPRASEWAVTLLDQGVTEDGRAWIVLPWYPWSLRTWIERTAPPLPRVLDALEQAVIAVWRLHGSGATLGRPRLHRDLKPDNFLVDDRDGLRVVLADFGGTRAASLSVPTQPGVLYTPRYAPVEQVLGLGGEPDPSVDTHALAVTLYWALTGTEPDARAAPLPLTDEGRRVLAGEGSRDRPLAELVDLDELVALRPTDRQRLRNLLEDELRGTADAGQVAETLLRAIEAATCPDPARRDGDLRRLAAACEHARMLVGGEEPRRAPAVPAPGGAARSVETPVPHPKAPEVPKPAAPAAPDEVDADPVGRPLLAVLVVALLVALGWAVLR